MTGCLKVNCPFKHFKPRNVNSTGNSVASTLTTQPAGKIRQTDIVSGFNVDNCVVVGVVQPAIPITQATIMQTSQKEGQSLPTSVSVSFSPVTSPVIGQQQTTPTIWKNDSFSFDLSKLTPSNPMPFAIQLPTTQNGVQPSNKPIKTDNNKQQLKFNKQTPLPSREAVLAAKKKARAARFGVNTQTTQSKSLPTKTVQSNTETKQSNLASNQQCQSSAVSSESKPTVSNKPRAVIQEIKWTDDDAKVFGSKKPKIQEIKWDLDEKKVGGALGTSLISKATKKRLMSGDVSQSGGHTENGQEKGEVKQTETVAKKIKLTAKVSPYADTILVKSFEEIMREKRQKQKQVSAAQSTEQAVRKRQEKPKKRESIDIASKPDSASIATSSSPQSGSTPDHLEEPAMSLIGSKIPQVENQAIERNEMNSPTTGLAISATGEKESMVVDQEIKTPTMITSGRVALRRVSSKVREDSLLDAELDEMLQSLSGSDVEDNFEGSKDDDDLMLDIEEFMNS
jgi:hypothetical protein